MTDVQFKVASVTQGHANARTEIDGESVSALVPCLEVELVQVGRGRSFTMQVVGAAMEEAKNMFKPDAEITASFNAKGYDAGAKDAGKK